GITPVKEAYRAKEWKGFGKNISEPIHGALGIKSRKGGGHVAFVVGKSPDGRHLYMLGGNQSNQVNIAKYSIDVWDKFVVPSN
ncbi:TIGR02594 family protein, partial [Vibrio parahaemolyticus]|nr:TIGR02594 family protein [Vibrio parahaemolyticus]